MLGWGVAGCAGWGLDMTISPDRLAKVYAYGIRIYPYINRGAISMYGSIPYIRQRSLKSTATADQRQQAPTSGSEPVRIACQAIGMWAVARAPEIDVWTMSPSSKASSAQ
jgi:hypothetical protein